MTILEDGTKKEPSQMVMRMVGCVAGNNQEWRLIRIGQLIDEVIEDNTGRISCVPEEF